MNKVSNFTKGILIMTLGLIMICITTASMGFVYVVVMIGVITTLFGVGIMNLDCPFPEERVICPICNVPLDGDMLFVFSDGFRTDDKPFYCCDACGEDFCVEEETKNGNTKKA